MQHLGLLIPNGVGPERDGRLHGRERHQLEKVVGDHVPQRSILLVVAAPSLHPYRLRQGDLYVVDVAPVPDGLEDPVAEAKNQNILDRLLSQIVIDPVDLLLIQAVPQLGVEALRRLQVAAKRFFHDHPAPAAMLLARQSDGVELADNLSEKLRGRGQVIKEIPLGAMLPVQLRQPVRQLLVDRGVFEVSAVVVDPLQKPFPELGVHGCSGVRLDVLRELAAKFVVGPGPAGEADDGELFRQKTRPGQVAQRGEKLALGQIAAGAADHHHAGIRRPDRWGSDGSGRVAHREDPPLSGGASPWPPNSARKADRTFWANSPSPRELKRWKSAALSTGAGVPSSTAADTVHLPSPESDTLPEKCSSAGSFASAPAARSNSHEAITLPRRHTSAMSARLKS